jgi:hypothetical protein
VLIISRLFSFGWLRKIPVLCGLTLEPTREK